MLLLVSKKVNASNEKLKPDLHFLILTNQVKFYQIKK